MEAIFDKKCNWVGWFDKKNALVYDCNLTWLGFLQKNSFFTRNCKWLGGFVNGTFVDKRGKPVAWLEGKVPQTSKPLLQPLMPLRPVLPLRPLKPLMPLRPLRPLTPLGGWSEFDWADYLRQ